jgi:hypothetical protein
MTALALPERNSRVALNTKSKRASATFLLLPFFTQGLEPSGAVSTSDRAAASWCYSGIAIVAQGWAAIRSVSNTWTAVAGPNIYFNDLSTSEGWLTTRGTVTVQDEELLLTSPNAIEVWTWIDTQSFGQNITIEFDIQFDDITGTSAGDLLVGRHGGIMFFANEKTHRYNPTMSGYIFDWLDRETYLGRPDRGYRFGKYANGAGVLHSQNLVPVGDPGTAWRITINGSRIILEVGTETKITIDDNDYRSGYIGFWGYSNGQRIHIDNIEVKNNWTPVVKGANSWTAI